MIKDIYEWFIKIAVKGLVLLTFAVFATGLTACIVFFVRSMWR